MAELAPQVAAQDPLQAAAYTQATDPTRGLGSFQPFLTKAGTVAFSLNIIMMIIGFYTAKFFASGVPQQRCISLECGLQNGTLAVFVGTQLFDNMMYMVPTAAYALIMMTTSVLFVIFLRRKIN